jgi:asparagine synthetase B (glutamine-hydrolysing)
LLKTSVREVAGRAPRIPALEPCLIRFGSTSSGDFHASELSVGTSRQGSLSILYSDEASLPSFAVHPDCCVILSGWIENRDRLVSELDPSKVDPDASAANLLLAAYLQHGNDLFAQVHGVFQWVILDKVRDLLFCVRDRFGMFPLFYADTGTELLIGSSIDSVLRHPGVSRRINRVAAAEHLSNRWLRLDETYYEKVRRVPPAHALRKGNGQTRTYLYWEPFPNGFPTEWHGEEALNQFDQVFERAVSRNIDPDETAIFLSGGLDSVSIASVIGDHARRNRDRTPLALSLIFPHPECNERAVQESVADQLNFDKVLLPFESVYAEKGLLQTSLDTSREWPQPTLTPWKPGYFKLAEQAQQRGFRVILSGDGGDEWLTVHPNYLADLMRAGNFPEVFRVLRRFMRSHDLPRLSNLRFLLWNSGLHQLLRSYLAVAAPGVMRQRRKRTIRSLTRPWVSQDPQLRSQIYERLDEYVEDSIRNPIPPKGYGYYFSAFPHMAIRTLSSMIMEESFEIGRRIGTWLLKPYYDSELVDLLLRIPPSLLQRGGREKGMVRDTVAKRFPTLQFERQRKVSALGFMSSILHKEGPRVWKELGGAKALESLGIVDHQSIEAAMQRSFTSSDRRSRNVIWEITNLETWVRPRV